MINGVLRCIDFAVGSTRHWADRGADEGPWSPQEMYSRLQTVSAVQMLNRKTQITCTVDFWSNLGNKRPCKIVGSPHCCYFSCSCELHVHEIVIKVWRLQLYILAIWYKIAKWQELSTRMKMEIYITCIHKEMHLLSKFYKTISYSSKVWAMNFIFQ